MLFIPTCERLTLLPTVMKADQFHSKCPQWKLLSMPIKSITPSPHEVLREDDHPCDVYGQLVMMTQYMFIGLEPAPLKEFVHYFEISAEQKKEIAK